MNLSTLTFENKLIQAPLAGYSSAPFRVLAHKYGKPDYCCTEMLSAHHIFAGAPQRKRYTYKSPDEGKLCVQLAGNRPEVLAFAAQEAVGYGADLIDLNCGCPMPKIRKRRLGSQLLSDTEYLKTLVVAMKAAVDIPVTVKIRITGKDRSEENQAIAQAIEAAGADAIIVHGRTWQEKYDVSADYSQIAEIKKSLSIPVVGNGDVSNLASAQKMLRETNCDAIMIARASVGQPWLFQEIAAGLAGAEYVKPTRQAVGKMFIEQLDLSVALEGEKVAVMEMRKFAKYYSRDLVAFDFVQEVYKTHTYAELISLVKAYFSI